MVCMVCQPAWSADLTATGSRVRTRIHVDVFPRKVEVVYPRDIAYVSNGRFITPQYSCWSWTSARRLQLIPTWSGPCAGSPYWDWSGHEVRYVERVRVH
jgi:hypothetical protein